MRRLFVLLLRLHPAAFRRRYGEEIVAFAEEECRRAFARGVVRGVVCVVRSCLDIAWAGVMERGSPTWRGRGEGQGRHEVDRYGLEIGGMGTMGGWMQDLRHAVRRLRSSPGFTLAAAGTIAIALGANAAIFSVVDGVLLDPLPYEEPDELVYIAASAPGSDFAEEFGVSLEFFDHYRKEATQLEELATFNSFTQTVRVGDRVERIRLSMPSPSLFPTLGKEPALGRWPVEGEGGRVAVISHDFWTTWLGSDPEVIGRSYDFAGESREVIGVMGPDFRFPRDEGRVMAWVPIEYDAAGITPGRFGLELVGRLAPGADRATLAEELSVLASQLPEIYGGSPAYARVIERHVPVVLSLEEWVEGRFERPLLLLMAAVVLVLLIACANVANLFSVRSARRGRELAVRRAMGAGRGELVRTQLAEAILLAGMGSVAAIGLAGLFLPGLAAAAPGNVPGLDEVALSPSTYVFTVVVAGLAALLFGLAPALRSSSPDLARLGEGGRGSTRRGWWGAHALVVSQTALTLVLLIGAGLLLRSFQELRSVDTGYDTEGILTFQFAPEQDHLVDGPSFARFHMDFMERLRALPGVEAVGIVENVPLDESPRDMALVPERNVSADESAQPRAGVTFAGGDYFEAMGVEILRGRGFDARDLSNPGSVILSETAAERLWPGEDPIGRRVRPAIDEEWSTVVGVVEDVRQHGMRDADFALAYLPMVGPTPDAWVLSSPGYVVRSSRAADLVPAVRRLIREVAPEAPMYRVHTMESLVSRSLLGLSITMVTLAVAAALALVLGAVGLYGVLSNVVAQRTREIGVRLALGAEAGRVRGMVVREGARVVLLGIVLGLGIASLASGALSSLLFEVPPFDPWTWAGTAGVLLLVGLAASWIPAWRASRVDPVRSMRQG